MCDLQNIKPACTASIQHAQTLWICDRGSFNQHAQHQTSMHRLYGFVICSLKPSCAASSQHVEILWKSQTSMLRLKPACSTSNKHAQTQGSMLSDSGFVICGISNQHAQPQTSMPRRSEFVICRVSNQHSQSEHAGLRLC